MSFVKHYGYVLFEIDLTQGKIRKQFFSDNKEANNSYRVAEIKGGGNPNKVVALVSTLDVDNLPSAYSNYFADSKEFIALLTILNNIKL